MLLPIPLRKLTVLDHQTFQLDLAASWWTGKGKGEEREKREGKGSTREVVGPKKVCWVCVTSLKCNCVVGWLCAWRAVDKRSSDL